MSIRKFRIPPKDIFQDRRRCQLEDWSSFLNAVCMYIGVDYQWFNKRASCRLPNGDPNQCSNLHLIENVSTYLNMCAFNESVIINNDSIVTYHSQAKKMINSTRWNLGK